MSNLAQKAEALAEKVGGDAEKLWEEFEAFVEGKKKVQQASQEESEGSTAPQPLPASSPEPSAASAEVPADTDTAEVGSEV